MRVPARQHWLSIASFICFFHCIFVPLIVVISPTFGHMLAHSGIELVLLAASIICGTCIIYNGFLHHSHIATVFLFVMGVLSWVAHIILEHVHLPYHDLPLYIGSLFVLVAYVSNYYRLNNHSHICDHT